MDWEYVTLYLRSRGQSVDKWFITLNNGTKLHGIDTILNHFRQQGWELVSLVPANTSGTVFSFLTSQETSNLLAVFKRPQSSQ